MPSDLENFIFGSHDPTIEAEIDMEGNNKVVLRCENWRNFNGDRECSHWEIRAPVRVLVDGTMFYNLTFFMLTVFVILQVIRFYFSRVK